MSQLKPSIIVSALVEKDNRFLLIKEILESGEPYWIIPGGHVEFGENLIDAIKREIKEETNLDIEIKKFIDFQEAIHPKYDYHTVIFFYHAVPQNEDLVLEKGVMEAKFFSKEEIRSLNLVDSAKKFLERIEII